MLRRYTYGLYSYLLSMVGHLPSHHFRRMCYSAFFKMKISDASVIYSGCEVRSPKRVVIQAHSSVGHRVVLDGRGGLSIGEYVNISTEAMLWTAQHDHRSLTFDTVLREIRIEKYAWIGPRAIVLPGVTIAEGCVIAAGAVLTGDTAPYGIYAGVPARRIGDRVKGVSYNPAESYIPFV